MFLKKKDELIKIEFKIKIINKYVQLITRDKYDNVDIIPHSLEQPALIIYSVLILSVKDSYGKHFKTLPKIEYYIKGKKIRMNCENELAKRIFKKEVAKYKLSHD